jgi:hypothetical protein
MFHWPYFRAAQFLLDRESDTCALDFVGTGYKKGRNQHEELARRGHPSLNSMAGF